MKEGTIFTRVIILLLGAGLAAYFGIYVWRGLTEMTVTTLAYTYTVNDSVEADGFLVREEQVLPRRTGITDVIRTEGEKVGRGQTIAVNYRDSRALDRETQIKALEMEIGLLEYALTQTESTASISQLEEDVFRAAAALRADTAAGDFAQLEDQTLSLKQAVLKRDYTYTGGADNTRLTELQSQLRSLQSLSSQDTSRVTADRPGTYSSLVDGYEELLTPAAAAAMTPESLDELAARAVQGNENAVGKLITSSTWYFVTTLDRETAQRLTEGGRVLVRFSGDLELDIRMKVESVTPGADGRQAVLLSSDRSLASVTLLRRQTVEIIFRQYEGLRVPTSAVHVETRTATDKETGESTAYTVTGVYIVVNGRAEFKEAEVLAEGTQFYVVRPLGQDSGLLRAGDTVIVQAKGLYNGKIVQ